MFQPPPLNKDSTDNTVLTKSGRSYDLFKRDSRRQYLHSECNNYLLCLYKLFGTLEYYMLIRNGNTECPFTSSNVPVVLFEYRDSEFIPSMPPRIMANLVGSRLCYMSIFVHVEQAGTMAL